MLTITGSVRDHGTPNRHRTEVSQHQHAPAFFVIMSQQQLFDDDVPPWELDAVSECRTAKVVFSEPPHGPLNYLIPDHFAESLKPGMRVKVPWAKATVKCWAIAF
ncbi:MAG: hypothetical protein U0930_22350 [Pirellulales bacterium]